MAKRQLSESDYNFIKETFDIYDENHDGFITRLELRKALQRMGKNPTESDVDEFMSDLAIDDKIGFDDFERCMKVMLEDDTDPDKNKEELREAFKTTMSKQTSVQQNKGYPDVPAKHVFDRDGNGFIDKSELCKALTELGEKLTEEEVDEMFREADLDGDGKINYYEFSTTLGSA